MFYGRPQGWRNAMPDKIKDKVEGTKTDSTQEHDGNYWSTKYAVTKRRLADAIKAVGPQEGKRLKPLKPE
jgi:hypothetical protein